MASTEIKINGRYKLIASENHIGISIIWKWHCDTFWIYEKNGKFEISKDGKLLWSSAPEPRDPGEDSERLWLTRLTQCLLAAEGRVTKDSTCVKEGDDGWSRAFESVMNLRAERDKLAEAAKHWGSIIEKQCGHNKAQAGEIAVLMAANAELRMEGDELRENSEGVQDPSAPIHLKAGEGLLKTKEGVLKVVKIDDLELQAKHHYLKWAVGQIEREAKGNSDGLQGTVSAAIEAVTTLRAENTRTRTAAEGLRSVVLHRVPCTCPPGEENNPECPLLRVEKLFDDFRQQIGVIKAPQPNPPGGGDTATKLQESRLSRLGR